METTRTNEWVFYAGDRDTRAEPRLMPWIPAAPAPTEELLREEIRKVVQERWLWD